MPEKNAKKTNFVYLKQNGLTKKAEEKKKNHQKRPLTKMISAENEWNM